MNDTTASIIIAVIGSGAFSAIVSAVVGVIQRSVAEKQKKNSIQDKALSMLILRQIQEFGAEIRSGTEIDAEDFRQFQETYNIYKDLGGNGYADKIMSEVAKMPLQK